MEIIATTFMFLCLTLIPVTNPIGMAPIFLSFTVDLPRKQRHHFVIKVALLTIIFLIGILVLGIPPEILRNTYFIHK